MVLIFKTSVRHEKDAKLILKTIMNFENLIINFDLEDCDNILRVECKTRVSEIIIKKVSNMGFQIEELF